MIDKEKHFLPFSKVSLGDTCRSFFNRNVSFTNNIIFLIYYVRCNGNVVTGGRWDIDLDVMADLNYKFGIFFFSDLLKLII